MKKIMTILNDQIVLNKNKKKKLLNKLEEDYKLYFIILKDINNSTNPFKKDLKDDFNKTFGICNRNSIDKITQIDTRLTIYIKLLKLHNFINKKLFSKKFRDK